MRVPVERDVARERRSSLIAVPRAAIAMPYAIAANIYYLLIIVQFRRALLF